MCDKMEFEKNRELQFSKYKDFLLNTKIPYNSDLKKRKNFHTERDKFLKELYPQNNQVYKYCQFGNDLDSFFENILCKSAELFNDCFDSSICLDKEYEKHYEAFKKFINKEFFISCFSETITSPIMWGHYADSGRGFALGYDISNMNQFGDLVFANAILPVIYSDEILNGTDVIKDTKSDYFFPEKIMSMKSAVWKYEKEWRFVFHIKNDSGKIYLSKNPISLYLGLNIDQDNSDKLVDIAKAKNIPVYQMTRDLTYNKYELFPKQIFPINQLI